MRSRTKPKANQANNKFAPTKPGPVRDPVASPGQPPPPPTGRIGARSSRGPTPTENGSSARGSKPVHEPSPDGPIGAPPPVGTAKPSGEGPRAGPGPAPAGPAPGPSPNGSIGAAPTEGRGAGGRFVRGNRGGTGNPHAKQVAKLRAALLHSVTEEDIQKVTRKLFDMGAAGDLAAAKLFLQYTVGKPADVVDPDDVENGVDLFRRLEAMPSIPEGLRAVTYTVSGPVFAELAERHFASQSAVNVLESAQKDPEILAQVAEAQRRRTA